MSNTHYPALDYLVNFVKDNPQILKALYGDDEDTQDLQKEVENPLAWELLEHRKPIKDDCWPKENKFGVFDTGQSPNQYGETTGTIPYNTVTYIRYFVHKDEMSDLGFLVLELKDGTYRLGRHADPWE